MSNAVRSRSGTGSRSPGLVDLGATKASAFHYENSASVVFGGTDEYIEGPTMDSLATFTDSISISLWFRWEASAPIAFRFLATANTTAAALSDGWGIFWHTGSAMKFFIGNYNIASQHAISDPISNLNSQWHHVAAVYDGGETLDTDTVKIYIDGAQSGSTGTTNIAMNALTTHVVAGRGGDAGNGDTHYMRGHMDEFAIWDTPLSAAAVTAIYNDGVPFDLAGNQGAYTTASDLKLQWRLGEGDSNTAGGIHDASGNGNTGTMTNMEDADIDTTDWAGI